MTPRRRPEAGALLHRALDIFAESRIPKVPSEGDTQETSQIDADNRENVKRPPQVSTQGREPRLPPGGFVNRPPISSLGEHSDLLEVGAGGPA